MVLPEWSAVGESAGARGGERVFHAQPRDRLQQARPVRSSARRAPARKFYTAPTELIPTDGIVRKTALEITHGQEHPTSTRRARSTSGSSTTPRATRRRAAAASATSRACSRAATSSGKCADLNALYVGLARSVGLPARDVYGLRVARSEFGYRSLGAGSPNVTRAQHCRAEVYLTGYGWVPVDPADVRKVVLEEKPQPTTLADPVVPPVRAKLFGAWEMNWLAYNEAHDVKLPGSKGPAVGFLMYPQAETGQGPARQPRPGQLQVHDHRAGAEGLARRSRRRRSCPLLRCSPGSARRSGCGGRACARNRNRRC